MALVEAKEVAESPERCGSIQEEAPEYEVSKKGGLSFITRAILPEKPKIQSGDLAQNSGEPSAKLPEVAAAGKPAPVLNQSGQTNTGTKSKSTAAKRFAARKQSHQVAPKRNQAGSITPTLLPLQGSGTARAAPTQAAFGAFSTKRQSAGVVKGLIQKLGQGGRGAKQQAPENQHQSIITQITARSQFGAPSTGSKASYTPRPGLSSREDVDWLNENSVSHLQPPTDGANTHHSSRNFRSRQKTMSSAITNFESVTQPTEPFSHRSMLPQGFKAMESTRMCHASDRSAPASAFDGSRMVATPQYATLGDRASNPTARKPRHGDVVAEAGSKYMSQTQTISPGRWPK